MAVLNISVPNAIVFAIVDNPVSCSVGIDLLNGCAERAIRLNSGASSSDERPVSVTVMEPGAFVSLSCCTIACECSILRLSMKS